jgi:hypothetical protein
LQTQLEHERELRAKERELTLRKEIYLAGVEALQAGASIITDLANLDIPQELIGKSYSEKAAAVAKLQVIATEATLRSLILAAAELTTAILELTAKRIPLGMLKRQIAMLDEQTASFAKERDRMLELMRAHNIEGNTDRHRYSVLQGNFDFEQRRVLESLEHHKKIQRELAKRGSVFAQECYAASRKLGELFVPVVVSIRSDLEVPIDAKAYAELLQGLRTKQADEINRFFDKLQATIDEIASMLESNATQQQSVQPQTGVEPKEPA